MAPRPRPPRAAALAQYRRRARLYDLELAAFEPVRRCAVQALALSAGETVLDVACGTGLSFPLLAAAVGRQGRVLGIEQSPEMMALARRRVQEGHWPQVHLTLASAESAALHGRADAALFMFTHDVLQNEAALAHLLAHLKPGARVAAAGLQWAPAWALPLNLFVLGAALYSVTTLEGLAQPWARLARHLAGLQVRPMMGGAVYLASGRVARAQ
jgi:demethylmenaquinone methyltransferase/2-methoxy-6-polyprenyl-1,4-benzoquinol methylase